MLARDWRAGELTVLGLALVLAVAALSSVGFLGDRVEQGVLEMVSGNPEYKFDPQLPGGAGGLIEYHSIKSNTRTLWDYWIAEPATTNNHRAAAKRPSRTHHANGATSRMRMPRKLASGA